MVTRIGRKKPLQFRRLYLKEHRLDVGLSQEQLAERMETTKATISRIETGSRDYTGGFLQAAADALGLHDVSAFYRPPDEAKLLERLSRAPESVKKQAYSVMDALLKTGSRK